MPRKSRDKSSTGIYHIMMRGNNRKNIFRDNSDKLKFLTLLYGIQGRHSSMSGKSVMEYEIYAYALMGNHFHILVKVISGKLSDFVKALASGYALYFNKKYERDGHLFKERYKSETCETDSYLATLLRYIHQNPVKSGATGDLLKYKYTSWVEYVDPDNAPYPICATAQVLAKIPLKTLTKLVNDPLDDETRCLDTDTLSSKLSDQAVVNYLVKELGENAVDEVKEMPRKERAAVIRLLLQRGAGICQLERILGVSKPTISRINRKAN